MQRSMAQRGRFALPIVCAVMKASPEPQFGRVEQAPTICRLKSGTIARLDDGEELPLPVFQVGHDASPDLFFRRPREFAPFPEILL